MHTDLVHQIFTHGGDGVRGLLRCHRFFNSASMDVQAEVFPRAGGTPIYFQAVRMESACLRARQYLKEPNS